MDAHKLSTSTALMALFPLVAGGCSGAAPGPIGLATSTATTFVTSEALISTIDPTAPADSQGDAVLSNDHSVMVHLVLSGGEFGTVAERQRIFDLEDVLRAAIERAAVGELDGHGFGGGGADLFAYGPDADALYAAMEPDIRAYEPSPGSYASLTYGSEEDAPQRTVELP